MQYSDSIQWESIKYTADVGLKHAKCRDMSGKSTGNKVILL